VFLKEFYGIVFLTGNITTAEFKETETKGAVERDGKAVGADRVADVAAHAPRRHTRPAVDARWGRRRGGRRGGRG
jgi:hypothetical protein